MAQPQLKPVVIINTFKHVSTFLNGVLSIILVTFLLQEVVSYVELKVSKMNILRLLLPRATGVFTLLKKKSRYDLVHYADTLNIVTLLVTAPRTV